MAKLIDSRISVAAVKVHAGMSEETICFEASVMFDGMMVARAQNTGKGGATSFAYYCSQEVQDAMHVEAGSKMEGGPSRYKGLDLETLVFMLVEQYDILKRLADSYRRDFKTKTLIRENGKVLVYKVLPNDPRIPELLRVRHPNGVVLNGQDPNALALIDYTEMEG